MSEGARPAHEVPLPGGDFPLFVTRLSIQGMLALGLLDNPLTGKPLRNMPNARMTIDDLQMLRDKTEGNLDAEERAHLDKVVRDLEHAYMRVAQAHGEEAGADLERPEADPEV